MEDLERAEERAEEQKRTKRRRIVEVYVVGQKGGSALVQWGDRDDLHRGYVPASEVEDGRTEQATLNAAIPYGVPWEELVDLSDLSAEKIARELRRAGVWTADDIDARRKHARGALLAAIEVTVNALQKAARELEKKEA